MTKSCISKKCIGLVTALILFLSAVVSFAVNAEENYVKVGLNYTSAIQEEISITIGSGGFTLYTNSAPDAPVSIDVNTLVFTIQDNSLIASTIFGSPVIKCSLSDRIVVLPANVGNRISYNDSEYYGLFELYALNNGKITIVNVIDLDDYLKGVLPSEVYPSWNIEALKAAAVVSRTYALKSISSSSHASNGYDICATTHCQMYTGSKKENVRTNQAIQETSSLILMYNGAIATTPYHSSTGGYTETAASAWGGNPDKFPYLTNVFNPYEDYRNIPNGKWISIVRPENLFNFISATYKSKLHNGDLVFDYIQNQSGYIGSMTVTDIYGNAVKLNTSGNVRSFFGSLVKSANFGITKTYIPSDSPIDAVSVLTSSGAYEATGIGGTSYITADGIKTAYGFQEVYVLDGKGYGHGVGMSQFGAKFMADAGFTFEKILETYYPGTELVSGNGFIEG